LRIAGIIVAIILFLLLVVSHEFGHYIMARLFKVRVNEFSVGMGPLIYEKTKGETQYSLRAIPIGGYCKLEGEDEDSSDPRSFSSAAWWKKIIILAAGAAVNIAGAFIILVIICSFWGSLVPVLSEITPGGPADLAGIKAGDKVVSVEGTYYDSWAEVVNAISSSTEETISVGVIRNGEELEFSVQPVFNEEAQRRVCGFTCTVSHSPAYAIPNAFSICTSYFSSFRDFLVRLVTGRAESNEVVGVVGIVSAVSEGAQYGISNVVALMAIISLNLGVVNLLPLPALDGGRIVAVLVRLITRGRFTETMESYINGAGMIMLFALMVFLIFKDTFNIIVK